MLLHYKLKTLHNTYIGNEYLTISPGSNAAWILRNKQKFEEPLCSTKALENIVSKSIQYNAENLIEFNATVRRLFPCKKNSEFPIEDGEISVSEFGEGLGLDRDHCRYIIDCQYAANFPMFSALEQTQKRAEAFCNDFGGCYYLYRYDINNGIDGKKFPDGILVRSTLSIRYPVPHKPYQASATGRHSSVRVKLVVPSYGDKKFKRYEYDGLVGRKGGKAVSSKKKQWWSWLLQGRFGDNNSHIEDLILIYTEPFSSIGQEWSTGRMLTQNQDNDNTPTHSLIVLYRAPGYKWTSASTKSGDVFFRFDPQEDKFMSQHKNINLNSIENMEPIDQAALALLMKQSKLGM